MHCLWEIIDNAVDEALGGHCDHVEVTLHHDGSVEVRDNGRGVPVDIEPRTGLTGVELVYTRLHAGGKFGGGSYTASGGLHGVGASVVNALSSRLDVEVDRGGKTYAMSFRRGEPGVFSDVAGAKGAQGPRARLHARTSTTASSRSSAPPGAGSPAPGCATGPTSRSSCKRRRLRPRRPGRPRAPDLVPRAGADHRHPRPARRRAHRGGLPPRRRHLRVLRVPRARPGGHRRVAAAGHRHLQGDRAGARRQGPHEPHRGRARVRRRRRGALGHRLRHPGHLVRQHHRHPEGRHPPGRLRPGAAQGAAHASSSSTPGGSRSAATSSRRTTPWRA